MMTPLELAEQEQSDRVGGHEPCSYDDCHARELESYDDCHAHGLLEPAQWQWQFMRDVVDGAAKKTADLGMELQEIRRLLEGHYKETQAAEGDVRELSERVCSIAHLVSCERTERQALSLNINKEVQSVLDTLDQWRSLRSKDEKFLFEVRSQLEAERCTREAFEDRHAFDLRALNERLDKISKCSADSLHEQVAAFRGSLDGLSATLLQQDHQAMYAYANVQNECFKTIQERCASTESVVSEHSVRLCDIERRYGDGLVREDSHGPSFHHDFIGREMLPKPAGAAFTETPPGIVTGAAVRGISRDGVPHVLAPFSARNSLRKAQLAAPGLSVSSTCSGPSVSNYAGTPGQPTASGAPRVRSSKITTPHPTLAVTVGRNRSISPKLRRFSVME